MSAVVARLPEPEILAAGVGDTATIFRKADLNPREQLTYSRSHGRTPFSETHAAGKPATRSGALILYTEQSVCHSLQGKDNGSTEAINLINISMLPDLWPRDGEAKPAARPL